MTKKITNEEALAKIKVWIQKYYEDIGREVIEDTETARICLINEIEHIIDQTDIPSKNEVIERLELDNLEKSEGRHFWTA